MWQDLTLQEQADQRTCGVMIGLDLDFSGHCCSRHMHVCTWKGDSNKLCKHCCNYSWLEVNLYVKSAIQAKRKTTEKPWKNYRRIFLKSMEKTGLMAQKTTVTGVEGLY